MKQRSSLVSRDILSDVESQFERWRRSRRRGTRIPAPLWDAAVEAARDCGVSKVASALRLDYYKLKQRLGTDPKHEAGGGAFVEIPLNVSLTPECVFELEDAQGTRLRVAVKGTSPADLEPLARALWSLAQ